MKHLNGNLLCVVDVKTTGLDPLNHELLQVCCMPLDYKCEPHPTIFPFDVIIKPEGEISLGAAGLNKANVARCVNHGIETFQAASLFEQWFESLQITEGKRLSPLAHNWPFDRGFLLEWLGPTSFDHIFDGRFRDTMVMSLFLNDRADYRSDTYPFAKNNLRFVASCLELEWDVKSAHDAMYDGMMIAKIYRRMIIESVC